MKSLTSGNVLKSLFFFSLPLMLGSVFQIIYNITDTMVVGRFVSSDALAAVGVTSSVNGLLIGFAFGITNGFSIPIAQAFGAEDYKKVHKYVGNSLVMTVLLSLVITVIALLSSTTLLRIIGTPENIFFDANQYAVINYTGIVFIMLYNVLSCMLRALGDSKTPLYFLMVSAFLNIVADLLFVIVFKLGVRGVAYATLASRILSVILCFCYIRKNYPMLHVTKEDLKLNFEDSKRLLSMGIPMALQSITVSIGGMILQSAVNVFGSNAVAAVSIANKIEQIVNVPMSCFGTALATFAAQNIGAKKNDRILDGERKTMLLEVGFSLVAGINIFFFGKWICSLFLSGGENTQAILALSDTYCKTYAMFYLALGILFVYRNLLQGLGYPYASIFAGSSELAGRAIVAFLFARLIGFQGICLAGPLAWLLADIPLLIIYRRKQKMLKASI